MTETTEIKIESIGARGDGVAHIAGAPCYVPFSAPGDIVRVPNQRHRDQRAKTGMIEIVTPGPDRTAPSCRHFGRCGGCVLQHIKHDAYTTWKRDLVRTALSHRGLDKVIVESPIVVSPGSRRRTTLRFRKTRQAGVLGFNAPKSDRIVDIACCPVLAATLEAMLEPLRDLLAVIIPTNGRAELALTATETGIDLVLKAEFEPDLAVRERIACFAESHDLARVSWRRDEDDIGPETLVEHRRPMVHFGSVMISPPAGAFLQPTEQGESFLRQRALASLPDNATQAIDLFAGCGAFALSMAERCAVHAIDSDARMVAALTAASHQGAGLKAVTAEKRDLFRRPVIAPDLDRYDVVIIDPPRAGARAQVEQIAKSRVPVVVGVSCNPATFARDARILIDGGYRLDSVTPVDQFLWSAHVELLGVFRRG
ncbi:MAG: class I SAM-dependent RNA methyltransferase [Sphingomonadales bacterium]